MLGRLTVRVKSILSRSAPPPVEGLQLLKEQDESGPLENSSVRKYSEAPSLASAREASTHKQGAYDAGCQQ